MAQKNGVPTGKQWNRDRYHGVRSGMAQQPKLDGREVLVVEDDPLIALDVSSAFEEAGAKVTMARTLPAALAAAEADSLSAAVLDHALGHDDSSQLCERLAERAVPYLLHTGYTEVEGPCGDAPIVPKPAHPKLLVATLAHLLEEHPQRPDAS